MRVTLLRYELSRIGWPALAGAPLTLAALGLLALIAQASGNPRQVNSILSGALDALPLVAGLGAAGAVRPDSAFELQLSLATSFRRTALRRVALATLWPSLLALVVTFVLAAQHRLVWPAPLASDQLIWLAPLLWLVAIGAAATLGLRAFAVGSGLLAVLWLLERAEPELFKGVPGLQAVWLFLRFSDVPPATWYVNREVLLLIAAALFGLTAWLLGHTERLLRSEE